MPYPKRAEGGHRGNLIVGRARNGEHICGRCYERGESFDYRDRAFQDFAEKHRGDEWAMLLGASGSLKGAPREDYREFMAMLKAQARKSGGVFGRLPYDPTQREAA